MAGFQPLQQEAGGAASPSMLPCHCMLLNIQALASCAPLPPPFLVVIPSRTSLCAPGG